MRGGSVGLPRLILGRGSRVGTDVVRHDRCPGPHLAGMTYSMSLADTERETGFDAEVHVSAQASYLR